MKTLEYLGQIVDQAREIVKRINELKIFVDRIESEDNVHRSIEVELRYGNDAFINQASVDSETIANIAKAAAEAARKEIARLEAELAKL